MIEATKTRSRQGIESVRKHSSKIRTIERNQRLGRYNGRNSASTDQLLARTRELVERILHELPREVSGRLTEEHNLAGRISEARDNGQDRPELKARLTQTRRELRELVA